MRILALWHRFHSKRLCELVLEDVLCAALVKIEMAKRGTIWPPEQRQHNKFGKACGLQSPDLVTPKMAPLAILIVLWGSRGPQSLAVLSLN